MTPCLEHECRGEGRTSAPVIRSDRDITRPEGAWHTLSDVSLTPTLGVLRSANTMIVAINARLLRIAR